jgi:hypothetical protein
VRKKKSLQRIYVQKGSWRQTTLLASYTLLASSSRTFGFSCCDQECEMIGFNHIWHFGTLNFVMQR